MKLEGIHHVTAITADAPGNVDFYTRVLGLRLVKKTVNQDDPTVYHLFYADEKGSPGSDLTFFEYPGLPRGRAGAGMVHTVAWRVASPEALAFWGERLAAEGIDSERDGDRLRFADPEGMGLELHAVDRPTTSRSSPTTPTFRPSSRSRASTASGRTRPTRRPAGPSWRRRSRSSRGRRRLGGARRRTAAPSTATTSPRPSAGSRARAPSTTSPGPRRWTSTRAWRERVAQAGARPTPVIDRFYFRSIYFREPSGVLFEIATLGPGFTADEPLETLGEALSLPPAYEPLRERLEHVLTPLPDPRHARASN